jgi:hypothetical protein
MAAPVAPTSNVPAKAVARSFFIRTSNGAHVHLAKENASRSLNRVWMRHLSAVHPEQAASGKRAN